VRHQPTAVA